VAILDAYTTGAERYLQTYQAFCGAGAWLSAVNAKANAAQWARVNGRVDYANELLDEAISLAAEHGLLVRSIELRIHRFELGMIGNPSGASLDELNREFPRLIGSIVNVLMIGSRRALPDDPETAGEYLQKAASFAKDLSDESRWRIELELAEYYDGRAEYDAARDHAEIALRLVRNMGPTVRSEPLVKLVTLRDAEHRQQSDEALAELATIGQVPFTIAAIARAQSRLGRGLFADALADTERALASAPTTALRRSALANATLAKYGLRDFEGSTAAAIEAIELLEREEQADTSSDEGPRRERYKQTEKLHLAAAWLAAEGGRPREAFAFAENGRARSLRRELALAGSGAADASTALTFDQVHAMLVEDAAALLTLGATRWGTLAVLADHLHAEPRVFFCKLSHGELEALLVPKNARADPKVWSLQLFESISSLSAQLMPELEAALRDLAPACRTLYVAPDSYLYRVPFAALQFADGSHLIEHLPVAVVPSAAVLAAVRSRRSASPRVCLAYGTGVDNSGTIYFRSQAEAVARLSWETPCTLLPERTSARELLAAMRDHSVVHLACHGSVGGIADPLAASQLQLFPPERLTARDVLEMRGAVHADLVFLNACQSGQFRMSASTEADGFWRAFLHAGVATLIATLTLVDPNAAGSLALGFYDAWLGGTGKAEALQAAQRAAIGRGDPIEHWASHIIVGDAA